MKRARRLLAVCAITPTVLAACGGNSTSAAGGSQLSGSVQLSSVAGATVSVLPVNADGSVGTQALATGATDASGAFSLPMPQQWPVVVSATGGAFTEEATGASAQLGDQPLRAALTAAPSAPLLVSPYSSAVVTAALAAGGINSANIALASSEVADTLGGVDPQTAPDTGTAASGAAVTDNSAMAFALGVESQLRTDGALTPASSVAALSAQIAAGNTLDNCNGGAGDVQSDGTLGAAAPLDCSLPMAARRFLGGTQNQTAVKRISALRRSGSSLVEEAQTASAANSQACTSTTDLLESNRDTIFKKRQDSVQALLARGVTAANWQTFPVATTYDKTFRDKYGPRPANYGAVQAPQMCGDTIGWQRQFVVAAEDYWVDQDINYCHHHLPGWIPPDDATSGTPFFRVAKKSALIGAADVTCSASRSVDGHQIGPTATPLSNEEVQWKGVDCSNFTAWIYNFAGVVGNRLDSAVGQQACSSASPGVLLDINHLNLSDATISLLRPGDLLYITQVGALTAGTDQYELAHVVTWTGKRWNDLQSGADAHYYQLDQRGQAGSRLGADFATYFGGSVTAEELARRNPWMIIDSHYAGPAYRPFVGWYRSSLSNVRRIVGADQIAGDTTLAPYVLKYTTASDGTQTISSPQASLSATNNYRMIFNPTSGVCYRTATN